MYVHAWIVWQMLAMAQANFPELQTALARHYPKVLKSVVHSPTCTRSLCAYALARSARNKLKVIHVRVPPESIYWQID